MKYLIFGNKGQLGKEFERRLINRGLDVLGFDSDEADITNFFDVYARCREFRPEIIINCAAYNDVDNAERDFHTAFDVNAHGVKNLALVSERINAFTVHFSSDYVFDGKKKAKYTEKDKTNPLNEYGKSKLAGEKHLAEVCKDHLIFRLSWVYGTGNQNFMFKMKSWAEKSDVLRISDDEISIPTFTKTIAETTLKAIEAGLTGTYHLVNSGQASRYEWAVEAAKLLNIGKKIVKAKTADFGLPAERPLFSAMDNSLICRKLDISLPDWKEDLHEYMKRVI